MKITYTNVQPVVEAMKQGGRIILVAVIPLLIAQLNDNTFNWKSILVTGATALLMGIDKYLHLEQKVLPKGEQNTGVLGLKGLTGF